MHKNNERPSIERTYGRSRPYNEERPSTNLRSHKKAHRKARFYSGGRVAKRPGCKPKPIQLEEELSPLAAGGKAENSA